MFSLLSSFFSNSKSVEKAVDLADASVRGIGKWIDNFGFTDEERSELSMEALKIRMQFVEQTLAESSVRSKTRRYIAIMFVALFISLILISVATWPLWPSWSEYINQFVVLLQPVVGGIAGFYFLYFGAEKVFNKKK